MVYNFEEEMPGKRDRISRSSGSWEMDLIHGKVENKGIIMVTVKHRYSTCYFVRPLPFPLALVFGLGLVESSIGSSTSPSESFTSRYSSLPG